MTTYSAHSSMASKTIEAYCDDSRIEQIREIRNYKTRNDYKPSFVAWLFKFHSKLFSYWQGTAPMPGMNQGIFQGDLQQAEIKEKLHRESKKPKDIPRGLPEPTMPMLPIFTKRF